MTLLISYQIIQNLSLHYKILYFPNEEVLGQRISPTGRNAEVVGVIGDVRHQHPVQPLEPALYLPISQEMFNPMCLVVRTAGDPLLSAAAVRNAVWAEDPNQPLEDLASMEQIVAQATADTRFYSLTLGAFALLALLLGALGLYGVMAHAVAHRTHEIGIRLALGAAPRNVLWMVVRQGMTLAFIGVGLGLAVALAVTRLLKTLLFNVGTTDLGTYVGLAAMLVLVAFIASYLPARKATQVDPLTALRHE